MLILVAMFFTLGGVLSRGVRQTLGVVFWVCLAVTLLTLYGMCP
jgi:hypothetical protein